ncbi:MAG: TorA maturation chaperone TorD [Planctomycetota bacterium]|jgi:TorA maturation chaperone TorD
MKANNKSDPMTTQAIKLEDIGARDRVAPAVLPESGESSLDAEQLYRASAYGLLAAVLRAAPDQALLDHLGELSPGCNDDSDDLLLAMSILALSAKNHSVEELEEEYHQLFIGLGKGEVVPYASWHLTGFLMEQPLSDLRDDLRLLGFARTGDTSEPEDHAAALFEVLSVMIGEQSSLEQQRQFFDRHMKPWLGRFYDDLGNASSAVFYQSVARFGAAYFDLEKDYFSMQS